MKQKIICIFIIIIFLLTASNLSVTGIRIKTFTYLSKNYYIDSVVLEGNAFSYVNLGEDSDNIKKISNNWEASSDIDNYIVIYGEGSFLFVYYIETDETDKVYMGGDWVIYPKISGSKVVYYDFTYMGFKIYNLETSEKTNLIVTNWQGGGVDDFQFFYPYIAYENGQGLYTKEIFLYNIENGENIQISDCPNDDYAEKPAIYENIVVWQQWEGNQCDIMMFDINSREYTRVTNTLQFEWESYPSIYENTIIYSYHHYDKTGEDIIDIYQLRSYNIETGLETTIFEEPANSPEIYDGSTVYSRSNDLNLYNLNNNEETLIYTSSDLIQPWNIFEKYIVFNVMDDGIYLYPDSGESNSAPNKPDRPHGKRNGGVGMRYTYSTKTIDIDQDEIRYGWDWDEDFIVDEWTPYISSGTEIKTDHIWDKHGTYEIRVISEDTNGLSSEWSDPLRVIMPRQNTFSVLDKLQNLFPNLYLLIDNLFADY